MPLEPKPAARCRYDIVSLGEVMLRLDPGESRIRAARRFDAWEGGGEYNVARGLSRVFGQRAAVLTALVDDEVGRLIEGLILGGGVDASLISWAPSDGCGRTVRNGLNFTERGFGVRKAKGVSDRGHTAASQLQLDPDWLEHLFGTLGVRWLHTGGIFAALSERSAATALQVVQAAKEHGTIVSYDLNYRDSLWRAIGGRGRAREVNRRLASYVDVMLGNEEDFSAALGYPIHGLKDLTSLPAEGFAAMLSRVSADYPNLAVVATTLRVATTASRNDWSALAWAGGELVRATARDGLDILDRVGGGDSFASGLIYALLQQLPLAQAVELGAAHGALAMTTPGDTSMASLADVLALAQGGDARVDR